ncbi:DUF445 family protein [Novosphingobium sp. FSY-8]|uniref:DUF445 family protein n=2 Tax=Novosphingobium ovatum TaxID=1908523 RepID=A0ABW9XHH8_9SPHN|nr:DUF445 family protein [Novosphingobium ovatum]
MAGLYGLARWLDVPALRAFAEAAMVGGLADWFAVTALFRRPLGLPIPHTAIIPTNKDRIADALADFLRAHFLTPQVVTRRMQGVDVAGAMGRFLAEPRAGGAAALRQGAAGLITDLLHSVPGDDLGRVLARGIQGQLARIDLAPLLGQALQAAMDNGRHRPLIDALLHKTGTLLESNEDILRAAIQQRASSLLRWTGLDETLANGILDGLYRLLAECIVNPDHPLRARAESALAQLAQDLRHDPATKARVAQMRDALLASPAMQGWLEGAWDRLRAALVAGLNDPQALLQGRMGQALAEFGAGLQTDARLRARANRYVRRLVAALAARHGAGMVTLVSATVRRWDAHTVANRIENAVGRDLQFIRVNGTLVGGLVGLALHLLGQIL